MGISKNFISCQGSDAAIILMLGSGGSTPLTKGVSKWLVGQGVSVLPLGPEEGVVGYHSFPLERVEEAIGEQKARGICKIGILGASITTIPALTAAAMFSDITLTIVVAPCDFILQGFTQGSRDGCREWPLEGESMLTWKGKPLPYVPYAYRHPDYWHTVQTETKGSGNMLCARRVFDDTEAKTPLTEEVMIPVENIRGRLLLIGCEDDCLWQTARYIRRMDERLKTRAHDCEYDALVYKYGTHYAFPESMLKGIIPVFADFLIGRAFLSAREHTNECKAAREDIDRRMKQALSEWGKS
jgi:hypothetical protein